MPPPETRAVYLTGTAAEVPEADFSEEVPRAFLQVLAPEQAMGVDELSGAGELRLYRLDVQTAEVHARGGHRRWGMGIDTPYRSSSELPGSVSHQGINRGSRAGALAPTPRRHSTFVPYISPSGSEISSTRAPLGSRK